MNFSNSFFHLCLCAATSDRITYITDDKEDPKTEENNVGFCLSYNQKKC